MDFEGEINQKQEYIDVVEQEKSEIEEELKVLESKLEVYR